MITNPITFNALIIITFVSHIGATITSFIAGILVPSDKNLFYSSFKNVQQSQHKPQESEEEIQVCSKCGLKNNRNVKFCKECGFSFENIEREYL